MRTLISAVAIALLAMNPRQIAADEKSDETTYRKAMSLLKDARDRTVESNQLLEVAQKSKSAASAREMKDRVEDLQDQAKSATDEARRLTNSIAPADGSGYGPAQIWVFDDLYQFRTDPDGKQIVPSPTTILECERRLLKAADWPAESVQSRALFRLAGLYRDTNRIDDAKKHLVIVADKFPEYRLILAQWARDAKEKDDVVAGHAQAALIAYAAHLKKDASDHEARFGCVSCLILLSKFGEARDLVNEGAALATTPELVRTYARRLTEVLVASFDAKERDPKFSATARFDILEKAVKLDPENPDIYNRMLQMAKDNKSIAEKVHKRLRELTESGKASWMGNLYLGIDAYQEQKTEAAREYWEKALKQSNNAPLVGNNLAYLLAFSEPVDLPRALELASDAVKKVPTEPRYRGTYGRILHKLGRYKEALPELEKSIPAYPKDVSLFRALSETCGKLGDSKKAEEYKKRANALETKPEAGGE